MFWKMLWFTIRFNIDSSIEKIESKISSIVSSPVYRFSIVLSKILSKLISEDILFMAVDFKMSKNLKTIQEMFAETSKVPLLGPEKPIDLELQTKLIDETEAMKNKTINNLKQKCSWLR